MLSFYREDFVRLAVLVMRRGIDAGCKNLIARFETPIRHKSFIRVGNSDHSKESPELIQDCSYMAVFRDTLLAVEGFTI